MDRIFHYLNPNDITGPPPIHLHNSITRLVRTLEIPATLSSSSFCLLFPPLAHIPVVHARGSNLERGDLLTQEIEVFGAVLEAGFRRLEFGFQQRFRFRDGVG